MKRYAIVRVDNSCPAYEDYIFCKRIDKKFRIVDTSIDCNKCKIRKNYGDTKEQLERKIAQVLFKRKVKLYKKVWGCDMGSIEKEDRYKQCLEIAKEIVEFLGVE